MNHIISPTWIYWINTVGEIKLVALIAASVLGVLGGFYILAQLADGFYADDEKVHFKKIVKRFAVALVILVAIECFVPSKDTLIMMKIAKYATWDNAELVVESIKAATNHIIEAMKAI